MQNRGKDKRRKPTDRDDMGTNLVRLVKFSMKGIINLKKKIHIIGQ